MIGGIHECMRLDMCMLYVSTYTYIYIHMSTDKYIQIHTSL